MAVGDIVMYGVGQEMAQAINTRHDVNLHAMPGQERPALVLEEVGATVNLALFLRSGRTWLVRDVAQGAVSTANVWWPKV